MIWSDQIKWYKANNQNYINYNIREGAIKQQITMQIQSITNVADLLNKFIQFNHRSQSIQTQILLLTLIKKALLHNPNNYYHQVHGRLPFQTIYEFIIDCISRQQHAQVLGFLLHVLALITKCWVTSTENLKTLYEGILAVFQQRSFCKENCFKYFTILVETMQDNNELSLNLTINDKLSHFSSNSVIRSNLQNYFVYHLLNELLAFANIFLDRSIVRNDNTNQNSERQIKNSRISEQNSRSRQSQSFQKSSLKHYSAQNSQDQSSVEDPSEQCELYKIEQNESVILSILSLIRACLSYDFSHTSRHQQQSQYQPHKSPIILPTKYSKYCKFSEYDIFLKSQNTTQMLNYLFLICSTIQLKIQILKILQAMARIHFRYFKNKTYHKIHLEDIGYVVGNLLTGLDLQQSMSVSIKGSVRTTFIDTRTKVIIAVSLGQIVSILLYHQPTFYLVENTLMEMIIQHLQTFIIDQILDPEHFNPFISGYKSVNSVSVSDLCLLIETFMSPFVKLKDFIKHYLNSSQIFSEKINELFIRVGQKFFRILNKMNYQNRQKQSKTYKKQQKSNYKTNNKSSQHEKFSSNSPIPQQHSNKWVSNDEKFQGCRQEQEQKFQYKSQPQNENEQTQTHFNLIEGIKGSKRKQQSKKENVSFIKSLFEESGDIEVIRNILSVFKVYCPKHTQLNQICRNQQKRASQRMNITNSDISYKSNLSETQTAQNFTHNSLDRNSERMAQKMSGKAEQKREMLYEKWMISWICNFENHFHVTGGHCRHSKDWQIQLHEELMKQLICDLNWGMENYIKQQNNKRKQAIQEKVLIEMGECIKIILLYVGDKIVNDCRISCQEYISKIELHLLLIMEWITSYCCFLAIKKQHSNKNKIHQLIPILDLINNIKIQNYLQTVQILKYSQKHIHEQKMHEVNKSCRNSLKYFLNSLAMLNLQKQQRKISEGLNDKVLYILLKFYLGSQILVGRGQTSGERSNQKVHEKEQCKEIMEKMRQTLMQSNGFELVAKVLFQACEQINLFSQSFFHNNSTKITYLLYDLIRDQCFMLYSVKQCALSQIGNHGFIYLIKCLQLLLKTERKTHKYIEAGKQNIQNILHLGRTYLQNINSYLSEEKVNCQCASVIEYGLQISIELSFINNADHRVLGLTEQLLKLIKGHSACLRKQQLTQVQNMFNHIINILCTFVTTDSLQLQFQIKIEGQNCALVNAVQTTIWLLQYLGCMFEIYAYNDATLMKIQNAIIEYAVGRLKNKCATGLIGSLQQLRLKEYKEMQQQVFMRLKMKNIQKIIDSLCRYLQKRTKQKIYLPQTTYQLSKQMRSIRQYQCIRVDNMILIICVYHHVWEYLHHEFSHVINSTISSQVLLQSIKHMDRLGVAWVIRKLQQWNMSHKQKLQFEQLQKSNACKPDEYHQNDQNQKQNLYVHEPKQMNERVITQSASNQQQHQVYQIVQPQQSIYAHSASKIINVEDIGTRTQINQNQKQVQGQLNSKSSHRKEKDIQNSPDMTKYNEC